VKQPKVPQSPLIRFFHSLKPALEEVAAFDRLYNRRLAIVMGGPDIGRGQGTLHVVANLLTIHRRHPFEKAVIRVALLVVGGKRHADGREAGTLHFGGQIDVRARHFGFGEGNVDMIMGVDPDRRGHDAGHARINVSAAQPRRGRSMVAAPAVVAKAERNCRREPLVRGFIKCFPYNLSSPRRPVTSYANPKARGVEYG